MDDRFLGGLVLVGSLVGIAAYFYLVFLSPWALLVIQLSAFAAVGCVLVIVAWIGYTLATTPPPEPFESFAEGLDDDSEPSEEAGPVPE